MIYNVIPATYLLSAQEASDSLAEHTINSTCSKGTFHIGPLTSHSIRISSTRRPSHFGGNEMYKVHLCVTKAYYRHYIHQNWWFGGCSRCHCYAGHQVVCKEFSSSQTCLLLPIKPYASRNQWTCLRPGGMPQLVIERADVWDINNLIWKVPFEHVLLMMPVGRPRLKPEVKAQHVQESRKRYEDQQVSNLNADKRREAARLRMQRKRAAIAASDFHTRRKYREKVAVNSEIYRARKRQVEVEQNRAAAAVKQKKRGLELNELRKKHPAVPRKAPSPAIVAPTAGKTQHLHTPWLPSPAMPLPAPVWPVRILCAPRCPHCFAEECIGCACMCEASPEWIEHEGGHFFPTCEFCEGEDCPGLM
ncbi:hypothetical protein DFH07DRAFT_779524 [Mycena maculata]|uniref:Uncharacterized protein n=1 Tax=Mycena maculata TaxID=230809 RepID=A0AAD7I7S6_9AGAR|nr:hypothetical protein DFH07DRAFT_779524 [Mycena maculata]